MNNGLSSSGTGHFGIVVRVDAVKLMNIRKSGQKSEKFIRNKAVVVG